MAGSDNQKLKLLILMDILKKYTDDDHTLNSKDIINKMKEDYNLIIERRFIYSAIDALINYGMDINKNNNSCGYYLGVRDFELAEIRLLIDAIISAPFITNKKTNELVDKLQRVLSIYQSDKLKEQIFVQNKNKSYNEEIYYSVDLVNTAITKCKKIKFNYHHIIVKNKKPVWDKGELIKASPYYLMWLKDKYYILAKNDNHEFVSKYRMDLIKSLEITDENVIPYKYAIDYKGRFSNKDFFEKILNNNKKYTSVFISCKECYLELIVDKFGMDNIIVYKIKNSKIYLKIDIYITTGVVRWFVANADNIYVEKPIELRDSIINLIKNFEINYLSDTNDAKLLNR